MWLTKPNYTVKLAGNIGFNVAHLVSYQNESLLRFWRSAEDGMLNIALDVRGPSGKRVAAIRNAYVIAGPSPAFEILTDSLRYSVSDRATGTTLLRVQRQSVEEARLDVWLRLYLPDGSLLDASPEECRAGQDWLHLHGHEAGGMHDVIPIGQAAGGTLTYAGI